MLKIKEAILVEGRYDKMRLSPLVDGLILVTNGFGIFKNKTKRKEIQALAQQKGIVILTDSDRAGFAIRNHIRSFVPPEQIKNAYIPSLPGKEKRKLRASKEGLLGVEGMEEEILLRALQQAGCGVETLPHAGISRAQLFADGFLGGPDSAKRRKSFCEKLSLPLRLSSQDFLRVLNHTCTQQQYQSIKEEIDKENNRIQEKSRE